MKLYTEEQVRKAYKDGNLDGFSNVSALDMCIDSLTPIELPSDEEIGKLAKELCKGHQHAMRYNSMLVACFEMGKKMKEQILNQNTRVFGGKDDKQFWSDKLNQNK